MSEERYKSPALKTTSNISLNPEESPNPRKTPIQILHEYGIKRGFLPVYEMEKAEGEAHHPSFVFSVKIGEITCTGQGHSKKAAKHLAAAAALNVLQIHAEKLHVPVKSDSNRAETDHPNPPNSVGILQELALQRGWRLPQYTVLIEAGPPHKREFTVSCRLESLSETAIGNSKKAAKKSAAEKMVARLQSLSGGSEITWSPKPSVLIENLRNSLGERMSLLRGNPLSALHTDYIQMMLELSKEQGFEVTYFNIDEPTVNGMYQCLAELSTSPVVVCHGAGISCSNAHNAAAHSALQYIKIMASK
ncbi:interferon-inducible double-stranded RNA-dependent protein kinase activator A homolog [Takifugu rubripes]|uniref:Protein kinase, interferon-inducible double stranded RNA dependent activator n=2 Tax=Takifugu TaxID=31032 RepID=H2V637_TAKRU|nr:interferon-inducible double-stranded RNA-dependent protein kinase activator A [Takifugu rubripes]XP_056878600.1 interferon-inducible double-stranded RNA-dependent protein kinase activator A homolog [Takifugu flavidus]XP_056878689.1 interferon-inducible double-stranded RNA-dependent protein kinase activator A homolog [Takifugu flavidus]XP_056878764.1 interferon-inducible double-stranded RNA-dependent protein kinase activator A homolog [Takifugu flavidus]XP_056878847.1 interferon-inducible dou|eukprot:XP_003961944.1 PREDICTED: interferon-inducible double-stranded RNA-dependent protein kinase activator A [Takifugu rubripes]